MSSDVDSNAHHSVAVGIPERPWDEIIPGLWLGGSERGYPGGTFGAVISVYDWHHARGRWLPKEGVPHISVPFYDSDEFDPDIVFYLADQVKFWRDVMGQKVLVRCQAGLNRSSLVVAAYLILVQDIPPRDAIGLIRRRRGSDALFNNTFREWLEELLEEAE